MSNRTPTTDEVRRAYSPAVGTWAESREAFDRWMAAHDAEVRAGVVTEEPEWGVWDRRDRVLRHVEPPTEENARREASLGGTEFEATRALPWVPVEQEDQTTKHEIERQS